MLKEKTEDITKVIKLLILPIKGKWFHMILKRIKGDEYREIKDYWTTRFKKIGLLDEDGKPTGREKDVIFQNGYGKNVPRFTAKVTLSIGTGKEEWGAEPGVEYYVLHVLDIKDVRL